MPESKQAHGTEMNSGKLEKELAYLRSKVADLSTLIDTNIIINSTLDLDDLVHLVMKKAQFVMKAEASSVMLVNEQNGMLECEVALGEVGEQLKKIQLKIGEGIAGWVAEHGQPQIIPDVSTDSRFSAKADESTGFQTRSILAAPLNVKNKTIGVAEVINRVDGRAFNDDDLALFCTFCSQVAMAIENARMHKIELENQRIEQELESARFIQQSFMPDALPSKSKAFSIDAKSIAAASIGGDFYDFVEFENNKFGVAVGDVTGKGVPAALYMARLVSDLRQQTQSYKNPAEIINSLNSLLVDRSRRGMFVTFQYGVLDAESGQFIFSNAGHLPWIRINSAQKQTELLKGGKTIPLGITKEVVCPEDSVQLNPGDYIVSITDGIIEAKNSSGELYSFERVLDVLSHAETTSDKMVSKLLDDVQQFSKNTQQHDDLTILSFKWNGS